MDSRPLSRPGLGGDDMGVWSYTEAEVRVFGDTPPWTSQIARLWHMVAWPQGPTRRPRVPWSSGSRVNGIDDISMQRRIEYWCPLLHLAWWHLGWGNPALGARGWVHVGMPTGSSGTKVLNRWWARNVLALPLWQGETTMDLTQHGAQQVGADERRLYADELASFHPRQQLDRWRSIFTGGSDGLHLGSHAVSPQWRPGQDSIGAGTGEWHLQPPKVIVGNKGVAAVLLDGYPGWYSAVRDVGRSLEPSSSSSHWEVDVVVRQLGWLGRYHRSPNTGVWHAVHEEEHLLGW